MFGYLHSLDNVHVFVCVQMVVEWSCFCIDPSQLQSSLV